MTEERGPGPGATRDAAGAAEPGTVSRLLLEIAQASEEEVASSWREALRPGDEVGRYQIRREIGRGGFGAVYEAFDPQLGRVVALKALKPGRTKRLFSEEWIRKEAEAVAKLDHPAIVTIFDVGTCPAGAYLVMELLQGETLAERIAKGPLPVDEALRVAEQMAEGLSHAHSRGVLHRDLKPANVFLCGDGRVKLLDFGLAHLLGTDGSSGAGTPAYMAPEQAAGGAVDERADVYAAAMVLGEMLTGRRPVERATPRGPSPEPPSSKTELMWEPEKAPPVVAERPGEPRLEGLSRPVARVVNTALSVNPEERPKDGGSWLAELRSARLLMDRPRRVRRIAVLTAVGVVLGLAVAGFATWRIWERQIPGGRPTVAVADFANETGESDLDAMSGLLITSLEQGTQLRVLTRGRMLDILKQLGKGDVDRIDEPLAREVGVQARANALLLASIRRLGDAYVVEMRALDPLHDEYVFTVSDQVATKAGVFGMVDRLGAVARRRLGPGGADAPAAPPVASITTDDVRAWALLSRSRQALDRGQPAEAYRLATAAIEIDPGFALAHFQLAHASHWLEAHGPAEEMRHLEAAERFSHRLPAKEQLALRALRASLEGNWEEAIRLRDQVAESHPLDKEALAFAGDVRWHAWQFAAAVPYFERALALDPEYRLIRNHLMDAIPWTPQPERHFEWLRREAAATGQEKGAPGQLRLIALTFLRAGSEAEAVEAFRRASAIDGFPLPHPSHANHLSSHGRSVEAERSLREAIAAEEARPGPARRGVRLALRLALGWALIAQGRIGEVREVLQEMNLDPATTALSSMTLGLVSGSATEVRSRAADVETRFMGEEPTMGIAAALGLLEVESREEAARVVAATRRGIREDELLPTQRLHLDLADAWSRGDFQRAELLASKAAAPPETRGVFRLHGLLYLGLVQAARRDHAGAVASLEAASKLRGTQEFPAAYPRILTALARIHEQAGDLPRARERNEELLRLWEHADPDLPRLVEAKAMQARLAAGGGASAK